jgi:hypothetical protein
VGGLDHGLGPLDQVRLPAFAQEGLEVTGLLWDSFSMNATVIDKKRRMTIPESVCQKAGLKPHD